MKLLFILYKPSGKQSKHMLLLPLGSKNKKLYAIETNKITTKEINQIIAGRAKLSTLSLDQKINWIKNHCPNAYRRGFRKIWEKSVHKISQHNVV